MKTNYYDRDKTLSYKAVFACLIGILLLAIGSICQGQTNRCLATCDNIIYLNARIDSLISRIIELEKYRAEHEEWHKPDPWEYELPEPYPDEILPDSIAVYPMIDTTQYYWPNVDTLAVYKPETIIIEIKKRCIKKIKK